MARYMEKLERVLSALPDDEVAEPPVRQPQNIMSDNGPVLSELADLRDEVRCSRAMIEPQFSALTEEMEKLTQSFKSEMAYYAASLQSLLQGIYCKSGNFSTKCEFTYFSI
jgi:hypothetical protein